ncbi:hypothetical protein G7067_06965 [Leucobacter insecticola]|uniref:Uncharacterized protein n=1 Tax=Leucobacter insecticola TaxID=2714934 RepID=A0A6G8FIP7_9MICO|nr:T7SS effector LXG polymorphic toxin [Leucobacter insecticola]QIM16221.1 hypothetical protein G7067_06965 [Leucobacter insecticola]
MTSALEALAGSENITGEGADAMRAYIREVHAPIVRALLSALQTFQTAVGMYWLGYGQVDGDGGFWLVRDEFTTHQTQLAKGIETLSGFATQLRAISTTVSGFETVGATAAGKADAAVAEFEAMVGCVKGQSETWDAYEATDPGFAQVEELLAKLNSIAKDVGNLAVGKGRQYVSGGFDASFVGLQDLLTPMDEYCKTNQELSTASWEGMFAQYREDKAARKPWWGKQWDSVFGTKDQMFAILVPFALGSKSRKVAFDAENSFTQEIRQFGSTEEFRERVRAQLRTGGSLSDLKPGGYDAGDPGFDNPLFLRDALTIAGPGGPAMPWVPGANRVVVTLGSYDLTAETVVQTGPNSAVVRFTATNDSTVGSMLRFWGDEVYEKLNNMIGTSGPFSKYTETFTWEETVTW